MGQSTACAWCGKPMLDAEHAKKHVVEQCEKAPWRGALAAAQAEAMTSRNMIALLVSRAGGEARITPKELGEVRGNLDVKRDEKTSEYVLTFVAKR